jgi:hypothetical protein
MAVVEERGCDGADLIKGWSMAVREAVNGRGEN